MLIIKRDIKKIIAASVFLMITGMLNAQETGSASDSVAVNKPAAVKQGVQVSGTITDAVTRKGIVGIRVTVENFSAAITDEKGHFSLKVPAYSATVTIEGEGYDTRRVPLKG